MVRVHFGARNILHQIRLQEDGFAAKAQIEQTEAFNQRTVQRAVIGLCMENGNAGSAFAPVPQAAS